MKKLGIIIITVVLLLGLGQCKKKEAPFTPNHVVEEGWVHITVKVGDDSKHEVDPFNGAVNFTDGDILYVGNGQCYVGSLEYSSEDNAFSGDLLENALAGNYLHCYFVGDNLNVDELNEGETSSFVVDIHDQSAKLPVLSYGRSAEQYDPDNDEATYTVFLENKCGLVKFALVEGSSSNVTVAGVKTSASIDFSNTSNPIKAVGDAGNITLYSETDNAKWAILLPQAAMSTTATVESASFPVNIPRIEFNDYCTSGIIIDNVNGGGGGGGGTSDVALFSVGSSKTVAFAPGNLQYKDHTGWRFAAHQWDVAQTTGGTWNTSDWVDLFGWGTWNSSTPNPLNTSTNSSDYTAVNLFQYDFGSQLNDGYSWRTLSKAEWTWLLGVFGDSDDPQPIPGTDCRTSSTISWEDDWGDLYEVENARYMRAYLGTSDENRVFGLIVFPDEYTQPEGVDIRFEINDCRQSVSSDFYNFEEWALMEAAGAIFLPQTPQRNGSEVNGMDSDYLSTYYWTSNSAKALFFGVWYMDYYDEDPSTGYPVRLVRDVEAH